MPKDTFKQIRFLTNRRILCFPITLLIICISLPVDSCAGLTKGPVLLHLSQTKAALMWETDNPGHAKLSYGKNSTLNYRTLTMPSPLPYRTSEAGKKTAFIHKTWLNNLSPGTAYSYHISTADDKTETFSFRTIPAKTDRVTFVVYGDSRTHPKRHRKIIEQIIELKPDFVVHTGDLVTNGNDYTQWTGQFFDVVKGLAESVPIYIAKGNHEGGNGNFEQLLVPPGRTNHFGLTFGPLYYFCADNYTKSPSPRNLVDLIAKNIEQNNTVWKFISYHIPSLNFGGHFSDWAAPTVFSALAKARADFVITGHSHQYERFRPLAPPADTNGSFVTCITAGGGGAPLYDVTPTAYHAKADKIHHFCLFQIDGPNLSMKTIDINGSVIDQLEITKTTGSLDQNYIDTAVSTQLVHLHQLLLRTKPQPLHAPLAAGKPFTVRYSFVAPKLPTPVEMTFSLRTESDHYQLPESIEVTSRQQGGTITVKLEATPLTDLTPSQTRRGEPAPLIPPIWLDCCYNAGDIQQTVTHSVTALPD